jgi:acyl carrier protein
MQNFIKDFSDLFDGDLPFELSGETVFKEIPGWDSLIALGLIVMVSNNYGKSIDGEIIRKCVTISDLHDIING